MTSQPEKKGILQNVEISDEDIYEAMRDIPGYLDITPDDLKATYRHAYRHAVERIMHSVRADQIMTRTVLHVERKTPLREVAEIMAGNGISGLPVTEGHMAVAGVISEKDFISRMCANATGNFMCVITECLKNRGCVALAIRAQNAEDIMTSPAISVREDTSLREIISMFAERGINRTPVVDLEGHLVGIVSRGDILRALHSA